MRKTKAVTRSEEVSGMVITGVDKPRFVSMVGKPANRRAFSVIRSEEGAPEVAKPTAPTAPRISRKRRSDEATSPIVRLTFPITFTDEQVAETITSYGLPAMTIERSDESVVASSDQDLQSIANERLSEIKLTEEGIVATVLRAEGDAPTPGKTQIAVTSIEFNSDTFSRSDAVAWLEQNSIDFDDKALDNSSGNFVLQRSDNSAGEEVRPMELESGVIANVMRSDTLDIPDGFVIAISEAAYGSWGWGILDFEARLANTEVTKKLSEGLCMLSDILENTLLYSSLPIDGRKELMQRSLDQFRDYATGLLDTLPRQLLVQLNTQRSDKPQEPQMSTTANKTQEQIDNDAKPVTRGELATLVTEAVRAASAPAAPATATTEAAPTAATAPAATTETTTAALTRSDMAAAMTEALAPLVENLTKLQGVTVLRSDTPDAPVVQTEDEVKAAELQRKNDPFRGTLNLFPK